MQWCMACACSRARTLIARRVWPTSHVGRPHARARCLPLAVLPTRTRPIKRMRSLVLSTRIWWRLPFALFHAQKKCSARMERNGRGASLAARRRCWRGAGKEQVRPSSARRLRGSLQRIAAPLRTIGIIVEFGTSRKHAIILRTANSRIQPAQPAQPAQPSQQNAGLAGQLQWFACPEPD